MREVKLDDCLVEYVNCVNCWDALSEADAKVCDCKGCEDTWYCSEACMDFYHEKGDALLEAEADRQEEGLG